MRICTACVFLVYAHDTPARVQHFSAYHSSGVDTIEVQGCSVEDLSVSVALNMN